jgi:uncharacterized protein YlaI
MRKYKTWQDGSRTLMEVQCDVCKKNYVVDNHEDTLEIQEFMSICTIGGYSSIFGDGSAIKLEMCQHCTKQLLGKWIRVNEE